LPYPPYAPHISEFKKVLEDEFGCTFERAKLGLDKGISWEFVYIERIWQGKSLVYPFNDYADDMRVHGLLLLSICHQLVLDCSRWGVTLSEYDDLESDNN
jgi:hypothetical protein